MKNLILKYGLISGAVGAVMMFCMALYLGNDPGRFSHGEVFGYTGIVLSMLFVFFGVRAYRDQVASGVISFGKAFQVGLMITLISCAIYVATWFVVSNTLMTDFMDKYSEFMIQQLQAVGLRQRKLPKKPQKWSSSRRCTKTRWSR
jgi:hypothetical protein